jgi:hypothetical protein
MLEIKGRDLISQGELSIAVEQGGFMSPTDQLMTASSSSRA